MAFRRLSSHEVHARVAIMVAVAGFLSTARADHKPQAAMMRFPDVSATQIVFAYADDLWVAPRAGGLAVPLASPPGGEAFPRFSPDGQNVAFVGNYDGNRDLYTIPVTGGVPFRVTHHPAGEILCDWTPDGERLLFFASGYEGLGRQTELYTVSAAGGMPEKLPVPYGAVGAISPDGTWLAYTPHTNDSRTWKRYRGGMATDIWLFNLRDHTSKKITDWAGTDSQPMWHGDKIYYMSDDGPSHRLNIWVYDTKTQRREQVTNFDMDDVKWPAIGPGPTGDGEIVFQSGADLYLLDLKTRRSHTIEITVPGDRPKIRPQRIDVQGRIEAFDLSPTGKRATFEARGDLWTAPALKGSPRPLTRTSGVAERNPNWSPDGRWLAYFSDETGEYELYVTQSDGKGETRRLTDSAPDVTHAMWTTPADGSRPADLKLPACFRSNLVWSPDSKYILFGDKAGAMWLHTLEEVAERPSEKTTKGEETASSEPATEPATEPASEPASKPADADKIEKRGIAKPGETILLDIDPWGHQPQVSWSHDSNWIAYTLVSDNQQSAIWLYSLVTGDKHQVTSGVFEDSWPTFDRKGEYLYFATNRRFADPVYEDVGSTFVYSETDELALVPLRTKVPSPWLPKIDEETWSDKAKDKDKDKEKDKDKDKGKDKPSEPESKPAVAEPEPQPQAAPPEQEPSTWPATTPASTQSTQSKPAESKPAEPPKKEEKPLEIDLAGFEERAILLPVRNGAFFGLTVNHEGKLIYVRGGSRGAHSPPGIKIFDVKDEDHEEKTVIDGVGGFASSADGKKLLISRNGYAVIDAAPGQNPTKMIPLEGMTKDLEPREEWRQLLIDAWRIERDYFYVANMHGVDWPATRDHYLKMLDDCVSRSDVAFLIRELISELNIGHTYYFGGGEAGSEPAVSVGLLGCDFDLHDGAYRIKTIIHGGPWDLDARGPLSQPGVKVKEGDYLLAVNDVPVDTSKDPWAAFLGLAGRTVTLTVSDKPTYDPHANPSIAKEEKKDDKKDEKKDDKKDDQDDKIEGQRDVIITLLGDEGGLRYRAWVERNRAYVEEKTNGQVGYLHVPDTGVGGQNELFRQFYGQRAKAALVIDERWNGGGQLPHRFIELLNRPLTNYWARRDGHDWPSPNDSHQGPKCMLINGLAGSGGDAFPFYFRQAKLGKLIGMRTWGGLVGISGNPGLIDGTSVTVPTFGFFKLDGTWGVEGHGVDPDIEVIDDPALMVAGGDPQLDKAIEVMLAEIERHPFVPPKRPADPDRSGMTVPEKDW
jgi:tricorn protease